MSQMHGKIVKQCHHLMRKILSSVIPLSKIPIQDGDFIPIAAHLINFDQ